MSPILPGTWKVPDLFHARLGEQAGRQRMMAAEGHLLLILHKIPEPGESDRTSVLFWRDPAGNWKSTGNGAGVAELKAHLEEFRTYVDKMEERMQEPPSSRMYFEILQITAPLVRTVRNMHLALQQAREALPNDRNVLVARDQAGDLERGVELLHADAKNGMEYMIARQAEEQAENSEQLLKAGHKLNLLIAIFLPLTAIGSAFGMNLRHGMEGVSTPLLFWGTTFLGLVLGFLVKGLLEGPAPTKKKKGMVTRFESQSVTPIARNR
ncbi:MAG: CorA family divalent cation transporter [Limisphaerales bacterium]